MTDQPDPTRGAGSVPPPGPVTPPPAPGPAPAEPVVPVSGTWGQPPAAVPAPPGGPATPPAVAAPRSGAWGAPPTASGWAGGPPPAPRPRGPRGTSGRTSLVVLGVILGVLVGANLVNAALPLPQDPGVVDPGPGIPTEPGPTSQPQPFPSEEPGQPGESLTPIRTLPPLESQAPVETAAPIEPGPVEVGEGVDVGSGFTVYPPAGWTAVGSEGGFVFQKGGVIVIVAGIPWDRSAADLATVYREAWFEGGQFTGDDPQAGSLGSGIPAAGLNYTGVWNGTQVDGAIITGATGASGLIINIVGPTGGLNAVSSDLDTLLGTVQYTGG